MSRFKISLLPRFGEGATGAESAADDVGVDVSGSAAPVGVVAVVSAGPDNSHRPLSSRIWSPTFIENSFFSGPASVTVAGVISLTV